MPLPLCSPLGEAGTLRCEAQEQHATPREASVAVQGPLADVWDRMEARVAETAALSPLIVSNGREDGFMMPDHLSAMAENVLRARANLVELREILNR